MLKVGLTGGIGSGKTLVCEVFKTLGIPVYSSDTEARNILNDDPLVKTQLISAFGSDVYSQDGILNRHRVSEIVFNNTEQLNKLNSIVHPAVRNHFLLWLAKNKTAPYIIKEAAILIESGAHRDVDVIVTVFAPLELRISRVMERDKISREAVMGRITRQMDEEQKVALSDYVIYNNDRSLMLPQILQLHKNFLPHDSAKKNT